MIEPLKGFPANIVAFACRGHVTKSDYETVLIPTVEKAVLQHEKLRVYYEIGPDFTGIDAGAVWDDMKIGIQHWRRWERVAIVTDVAWIKNTVWVFGFLIPAEMKVFSTDEAAQARSWITSAQEPALP